MSKDDHDRIDNFQRNVLLARAKIDKTPDFKKSKDSRPDISPLKTRAKKNSSETAPCVGKILTKKKDSKLSSSERCNTKAPRHTSPPEKEISPSSKAPDQKKRKRSNAVVKETSYDVQHDRIKSEQYTYINPETEKVGYDHHRVSPDYSKNIRNTPGPSKKSPAKTKRPEDSIIQELQQISAQLNSEPDSCTLSPMQSRMTYGESRYQKPAQAQMKGSDTDCVETNSDNPNVHNFIGPQLTSHNYPAGLGPPGIELPSTALPSHGTPQPEIFYREQPRSGSTVSGYIVPQPISQRYPPGFDPSEIKPPVAALLFHDHSTATANNQYSRTSDYSTQCNSQSLAREERVEPSCIRDEQRSQNLNDQGSNNHRTPHSNRAAVSGYLKYFEPEPSLTGPKPDSFTNEENDRSSYVVSEKSGKVKSRNFIGKHPSMMKKLYRRDFNKENIALPLETDSDGEVQAILSGHSLHKDSSMSDSFKTSNSCTSHSNMKKPAVIPTFTQLNNSTDYQYKTPPGRGNNTSRVQDGRWSLGSVESRGSEGGSPAGRAARHSSPSKNKYTGKPRSSNSSPVTREVKISKALTGICRHRHGSGERLMMLEGGYFSVEEILNTTRFKQMSVTREEVEDIVRNNDKQRFSLKDLDGNLLICANQGHSFEVKGLELERIHSAEGYTNVVHGTYDEAWESIKTQGLSRMNRTHIHFALGLPSNRQVISGMRADCEVVIYIDMKAALQDGYEFYRSKNNVILCSGDDNGYLPPQYFTSVIRLKGRRELLQESKSVVPGFHPDSSSPSTSPYKPNTTSSSVSHNKPKYTGYSAYQSEADRSSNWRRSS